MSHRFRVALDCKPDCTIF